MKYEIGLIFVDDKDYTNKAKWCNEHNCYIEEIEAKEDGTRQFQIKQIPQKTEDGSSKLNRYHRKQKMKNWLSSINLKS